MEKILEKLEKLKLLANHRPRVQPSDAAGAAAAAASNLDNDDDYEQMDELEIVSRFVKTPTYIKNGTMRDYQLRGLNWMITLYENGVNGILADEMGLGKTLQCISLLGYMKHHQRSLKPSLIVVPKSTLSNWMSEFEKWCPSIKAVCLKGSKKERHEFIVNVFKQNKWEIVVTTYEMILLEKANLRKPNWNYLIVDEAQRIKNDQTKLSIILRKFKSRNRLLMTGTPLQNNLHELWSLLNFLVPDIFESDEDFNEIFDDENEFLNENNQTLITKLHAVLKPFLLRRLKSEVEKNLPPKKEINLYVGLTNMQIELYKKLLLKDLDIITKEDMKPRKATLHCLLMHLRKCCNHPYLFPGQEVGPPYTTDQHLVKNCGKMILLDKLLSKLKEQGSRVLIFCQMTMMMDILQDYLEWKDYDFCRLDGDTSHDDRKEAIDAFNAPNSEKFVFILSTRAGGLGINLATADTVIVYDSDWNPQVDIQAIDRAHRIGQTKTVRVFRLITENTIEERIIERAQAKLQLDYVVIQQSRLTGLASQRLNKYQMLEIIRTGASYILSLTKGDEISDKAIDEILAEGEKKTMEIKSRLVNSEQTQARSSKLTIDTNNNDDETDEQLNAKKYTIYHYEGTDYREKQREHHEKLKMNSDLNLGTRERKLVATSCQNYNLDYPDYQFYPKRSNIAGNESLANERGGFADWTKKDFYAFIRANERYGRDNIEAISTSISDRTPQEVIEYAKVFWQRYTEIEGYKYYLEQIEKGEKRVANNARKQQILDIKMSKYDHPYEELVIDYADQDESFNKDSSIEADRFLICKLYELGLDKENVYQELKFALAGEKKFQKLAITNQLPMELYGRCNLLINLITREIEKEERINKGKTQQATLSEITDENQNDDNNNPIGPLTQPNKVKPSTSASVEDKENDIQLIRAVEAKRKPIVLVEKNESDFNIKKLKK